MIEQAIAQTSVNLMGGLNSGVKVEAKEVDAPEMISILEATKANSSSVLKVQTSETKAKFPPLPASTR
jgi:hypothetical protein